MCNWTIVEKLTYALTAPMTVHFSRNLVVVFSYPMVPAGYCVTCESTLAYYRVAICDSSILSSSSL